MAISPQFPDFKPLDLEDLEIIRDFLWKFQPQTSEFTFTNLFIWRLTFGWQWSVDRDWLFLLGRNYGRELFFLPPVGPSPRQDATLKVLEWLKKENTDVEPRLERADKRLVTELVNNPVVRVEAAREHFDYVYRGEDLISLKGSRYHAKRNHINKFLKTTPEFRLEPISEENLGQCIDLQEKWCLWRRCEEDMNLLGEWEAVKEALAHYRSLRVEGAAITIDGKVEAFTLGELLNTQTAVIHIEKANPEIPSLYTLINQKYCQEYWGQVTYINREQDLGEEGLRRAKLSYHPDHLVEKFIVRLAG